MKESTGKMFLPFSSVLIPRLIAASLLFGAIVHKDWNILKNIGEIFESLSSQA